MLFRSSGPEAKPAPASAPAPAPRRAGSGRPAGVLAGVGLAGELPRAWDDGFDEF